MKYYLGHVFALFLLLASSPTFATPPDSYLEDAWILEAANASSLTTLVREIGLFENVAGSLVEFRTNYGRIPSREVLLRVKGLTSDDLAKLAEYGKKSMPPTSSPFHPKFCWGDRMTRTQVLMKLGQKRELPLGSYRSYQRTRECNKVTGCLPWVESMGDHRTYSAYTSVWGYYTKKISEGYYITEYGSRPSTIGVDLRTTGLSKISLSESGELFLLLQSDRDTQAFAPYLSVTCPWQDGSDTFACRPAMASYPYTSYAAYNSGALMSSPTSEMKFRASITPSCYQIAQTSESIDSNKNWTEAEDAIVGSF